MGNFPTHSQEGRRIRFPDSRQKALIRVLPRVTAALSKFFSPIATSKDQRQNYFQKQEKKLEENAQEKERNGSADFKPFESKEKAKPELRLVPPPVTLQDSPAVTQTLLQLFSAFQKQRGAMLKWLGGKAYQNALRSQKKAGKFRKGAMYDQKVE